VSTSIKATLSVGLLLLVTGSFVAVITWPQGQPVALESPHYASAARFELGLLVGMLGLLLVLIAGLAYGAGQVGSIKQDTKP
jgi:hypothetical protein